MSILEEIAPNLWSCNDPCVLLGMPVGHVMTVARLADGALWVHSPVPFADALWAELEALGTPRHLIIPSRTHDLHLEPWLERFDAAATYAPPALKKAHADWAIEGELTPTATTPFQDELPHRCLMGATRVSEVVFLHAPSKSLILVDSLFNLERAKGFFGRLMMRLDGVPAGVGMSRLFRLMIRDKAAFRASMAEVLEWDFERIVVGHGACIEGAAVEEMRRYLASV